MFNPSNLVFLEDSYLSLVRSIDYRVLLAVGGVWLFSRFLRSCALWLVGRRYGIRGSFLLAQLPFLSIFLNYRFGKELGGMGARVRLMFRVLLVFYLVGLVLAFIAPSFELMVGGFVLSFLSYLLSVPYWGTLSEGISGRESVWWYIPIVGSILMLYRVGKSYGVDIYSKPKNYDTLFRRAEDLEISL